MYKRPDGFTLVELLIVIVVIAILASISVVAYNGIQTRANNTQNAEAVKQYIKAYNLYAIDNGNYPTGTGCLGEGYPGTRCLSQASSGFCFGLGAATNMSLNDALRPYMTNIPKISPQEVACGTTTYMGAYAAYNTTTDMVHVYMPLKGDVDCPSMSPNVYATSKSQQDSLTMCLYRLSAIN